VKEAVFEYVVLMLKQIGGEGKELLGVLGMDMLGPEPGILDKLLRLIP
jgi:hypothetical protein